MAYAFLICCTGNSWSSYQASRVYKARPVERCNRMRAKEFGSAGTCAICGEIFIRKFQWISSPLRYEAHTMTVSEDKQFPGVKYQLRIQR